MARYSSSVIQPQPQSIQPMKLSELLGYIKGVISNAFSGTYWITAEVSNISQSPHNGHVYFDLVETQGGVKMAFVRGNLWASRASQVLPRFYQVTGGYITIGMELMMLVKVEMHPQYGLSLTIFDINPDYTLGHLEKHRQETIQRLKTEGIWDLNRQHQLPTLLQRLAVITSATAAGWGDFQKQILQNPVGRLLKITLFSSMMQGNGTTKSIGEALDQIYARLSDFDAVVIIRGGGSKMDLSAFDEYHLCCMIANFPLPVITGIGHDKDISVADMVAHSPHKTPTAVADFLLRRMEQVVVQLLRAEERVVYVLQNIGSVTVQKLSLLTNQIRLILEQLKNSTIIQNHKHQRVLEQLIVLRLKSEEFRMGHMSSRVKHYTELKQAKCKESLQSTSYQTTRLVQYLQEFPSKLSKQIEQYERLIRLHNPQNIMKRGFLPVLKNGKPVQYTDSLSIGDQLKVIVMDGELTANVDKIIRDNDE